MPERSGIPGITQKNAASSGLHFSVLCMLFQVNFGGMSRKTWRSPKYPGYSIRYIYRRPAGAHGTVPSRMLRERAADHGRGAFVRERP